MGRLRRITLALVGAALISAACEVQSCNQITNPAPIPSPSPSVSPSPVVVVPGCQRVYSIGVSVEGHPNPLLKGTEYVLDVTPKGPDGQKLDPICHGGVVTWTLTGTAACTLAGNVQGFNPRLRCSNSGSVTAQACVSAPGGCGSVTVPVA